MGFLVAAGQAAALFNARFLAGGLNNSDPSETKVVLRFTLCSTAAGADLGRGTGGLLPFVPKREGIPMALLSANGAPFRLCASGCHPIMRTISAAGSTTPSTGVG